MKLRDILNKKINKKNNQISFDVRKLKLKELDLKIDDILELKINKKDKWQR